MKSNYEVDLAIKVLALLNYAYGEEFSTHQIADFLRVNEANITRWVKLWNEQGLEGLKSKKERDLEKLCREEMKEWKEKEKD